MSVETKGWCPDVYRPMRSGDGLILRIKPWMNCLTPKDLLTLVDVMKMCELSSVELTSRANIQLRGLSEGQVTKALLALQKTDLISDEIIERRRNILVSPLLDHNLVQEFYETLVTHLLKFPKLPNKFGFGIDGGDMRYLLTASADIRFEFDRTGHVITRADGAEKGIKTLPANAIDVALELAHWFVTQNEEFIKRDRMRDRVKTLPEDFMQVTPETPEADLTLNEIHVAPVFGIINIKELYKLAQCALVKITPWRSLYLSHAIELNWISHDQDIRRNIIRCVGLPFCEQACQNTQDLAQALINSLKIPQDVHISGCAKKCASQAQHQWLLVGNHEGEGFDVWKDGTFLGDKSRNEILELARNVHAL